MGYFTLNAPDKGAYPAQVELPGCLPLPDLLNQFLGDKLVRLPAGIETVEDILAGLEQALERV